MASNLKGSVKQPKSKLSDQSLSNPLQQSLKLLQQLYQARLIDKIARPIDRKVKEEYIERYQQKLDSLHDHLSKIKSSAYQKQNNEGHSGKNKSVLTSTTHKTSDWGKHVRMIQSRYTEILIEGSYKYFKIVCQMLGLRYNTAGMEPVNIQAWANYCLQNSGAEDCC